MKTGGSGNYVRVALERVKAKTLGGEGSGNFGHGGLDGVWGGSGGGSASKSTPKKRTLIPNRDIKLSKADNTKYYHGRAGKLGKSNLGKCFDMSGGFALDNQGLEGKVVQGTIEIYGIPIAHGWVELPDNTVFDGTQTQYFDREDYYKATNAKNEHEYTFPEAQEQMIKTGHYGPWKKPTGMLKGGKPWREKL